MYAYGVGVGGEEEIIKKTEANILQIWIVYRNPLYYSANFL